MSEAWPALRAARARDPAARVPFVVNGAPVGSVARAHLAALRDMAPALQAGDGRVALHGSAEDLCARLATLNLELCDRGLIRAWRDESFPLYDPATLAVLAQMERAACRFWGTLTLGAHATGYVADARGRPTHLWIAQRSFTKATDPGRFDNLIGGGVPLGQTPAQALHREAWEEAGLRDEVLRGAVAGPVVALHRDIAEGLQQEWLYAFDLALPPGLVPVNQDGEVANFRCLPVAEALQLAAGDTMTVDAALVTLDFALRHALLPADAARTLHERLQPLRETRHLQPI